jgi:hypothetical protein
MTLQLKLALSFFFLSLYSFCQDQEATIYFVDGESFKGYGMIEDNKVKFRASLESKSDYWDFDSITRIDFLGFEMSKTFEYVKLDSNSKPVLLELLSSGEVSLYKEEKTKWIINDISSTHRSTQKINLEKYYLKRKNDDHAKILSCGVLNWKKCMSKKFSDCEYLIKKINSDELQDIPSVVDFYNNFCGE